MSRSSPPAGSVTGVLPWLKANGQDRPSSRWRRRGWTNARTGQTVPGGSEVTADAPLRQIPLFLRDGALVPIRD